MTTFDENTLIYDIESSTAEGLPDGNKDTLKLFACYSYKLKKILFLTKKEDIQKIINSHHYLIGFNNQGGKDGEGYDNLVLKRFGIKFDYKIIIDLRTIFKERAQQMKVDAGMLGDIIMSYSLKEISKIIGVVNDETGKLEIDYKIMNKDTWTAEEVRLIKEYTSRDIEVTRKMYEWVEDYFWAFRDFLSVEDVRKKTYLTASTARVVYKIICRAMNWKEDFGEKTGDEGEERIKGGYVSYPAGERFDGNIYVTDFASLYPHIMMMANLHNRHNPETMDGRPTWNGGGKWKVQGEYYADYQGGVAKLLQKWYGDRAVYKKNKDKREYTLKIVMNTIYGMTDDPYYKLVYDKIAAGDCTGLGRQFTKYARKRFRESGFKVIYSDTDSIFLQGKDNDTDKFLEVKQAIIDEIKASVPFPQDTFNLALEDKAKYIFFFKGGTEKEEDEDMDDDDYFNRSLGYMKKNYIFVTDNDKVVIKNLGLRKKSNSELSKKIFWGHLVPKIKEGQIKFSRKYIMDLIEELLKKDIKLASLRKDVGTPERYVKSEGSLPAQISRKYGPGICFLIPNTRSIGVGKGKSYCTEQEFKEHGLTYKDVDISGVLSEIDYFIKPPVTVDIFSFESPVVLPKADEGTRPERPASTTPSAFGFLRSG